MEIFGVISFFSKKKIQMVSKFPSVKYFMVRKNVATLKKERVEIGRGKEADFEEDPYLRQGNFKYLRL